MEGRIYESRSFNAKVDAVAMSSKKQLVEDLRSLRTEILQGQDEVAELQTELKLFVAEYTQSKQVLDDLRLSTPQKTQEIEQFKIKAKAEILTYQKKIQLLVSDQKLALENLRRNHDAQAQESRNKQDEEVRALIAEIEEAKLVVPSKEKHYFLQKEQLRAHWANELADFGRDIEIKGTSKKRKLDQTYEDLKLRLTSELKQDLAKLNYMEKKIVDKLNEQHRIALEHARSHIANSTVEPQKHIIEALQESSRKQLAQIGARESSIRALADDNSRLFSSIQEHISLKRDLTYQLSKCEAREREFKEVLRKQSVLQRHIEALEWTNQVWREHTLSLEKDCASLGLQLERSLAQLQIRRSQMERVVDQEANRLSNRLAQNQRESKFSADPSCLSSSTVSLSDVASIRPTAHEPSIDHVGLSTKLDQSKSRHSHKTNSPHVNRPPTPAQNAQPSTRLSTPLSLAVPPTRHASPRVVMP